MSRPRVAVFRPDDGRIDDAADLLDSLGAEPVPDPMLTIEPTDETPPDADFVVLTSSTGVDVLADAGWAPGDAVLCCIGASTAEAAESAGWTVDRVPEQYDSAGMVASLRDDVDGKTVALARSDRASATMPEGLRDAGADVSETTLYRLERPDDADESAELAARGELDGAAFTSASTVEGFLAAAEGRGIREDAVAGLNEAVVGAIAESPAETAREAGITVDVVPEEADFETLARAVVERAER
ncbi:uroporphyrinogen-III synthase [Halolamina sp. CBA1230]|uniref:uroporphyrinogen-III synthase n=1 Tax=Halolamina sp. CBA1230 TaxID=1853690 RepID=UPI0009A1D634|nr:uroporphyrinogen-III synthase [Halolamina sp. CBA1230]QKY21169.1 uroporphyrinogen-III synthase [Halolamina sp. CBA1230]